MRDAYRRNRLTGFLVYFCCSRHSVNMPLRLPPRPSRLFFVFVFFFFGAREEAVFGQRLRSKGELRGLYSLRSSLGIRAKNWPRKTDPCEKWDGITCQNGSVTALDLSALRRTRLGKLSPFFSVDGLRNLTTLSVFNSTGFTLSGSIPDWFGSQLSNSVSILDLRLSSITGSIPSSLGDMTGLVELSLSGNLLTGEIPFRFAQLRNLTKLDLSNNMLEGSLPPVLGDLSSLKLLNVGHNSLSGSVPNELSDLKRLQLLDFGNNSFIGSLPETMFQSFIQLNSLSLNNNKFSGVLPDSLWTLSNLRLLDVSDNNFTGSLLEIAARFNVTNGDLNFSNNLFYGSLPSWIGLRSLDVSSNYFQGDLPLFQNGNQNVSVETNCFTNATSQRSVDDCSSFYTSKGLKYGSIDPLTPNQNTRQNSRNKLLYILVGVFGGLFLILLAILLVCFCKKKRKAVMNQHPTRSRDLISSGRRAPNSRFMPNSGFSLNLSAVGDSFTYDQLLQATSNFSDENLIKHGHSGDLYHGNLSSGARVVVKRVDVRTLKKEPYLVELDFFARASHTRLVPLLGHCLENDSEKLIVYKDMPNGDLSTALFRKPGNEEEGLQSLDWITRLKIAIGVAEALCYMHHECTPPLVHRDIQASSVILDDRFEVRLGSMSEVCVQEGGGHQNAITKFLRFSQSSDQTTPGSPPATCTYDVYCMGKVLLELVTGHLGISASNDAATNAWLDKTLANISIYEKDLLTNILDPSLILDEDLMEEVWAMAIVAKSCLNPRPSKRPQVKYVLKALENPLKVVRDETISSSARLRATSSRGSWNAALFGSWRSSSDIATNSAVNRDTNVKYSGNMGSQGSVGEQSFNRRRPSKEIFPEPSSSVFPNSLDDIL